MYWSIGNVNSSGVLVMLAVVVVVVDLTRWPFHLSSTNDVEVKVVHTLAAFLTVVDYCGTSKGRSATHSNNKLGVYLENGRRHDYTFFGMGKLEK